MVRILTVAAVLISVCRVQGSHSYESERDQYKAREDEQQLRFSKATDHAPNVYMHHRFGPFMKKMSDLKLQSKTQAIVPELQVGCGEGFTELKKETTKNPEKLKLKNKLREKRDVEEFTRKRRGLGVYTFSQTPPLQSYELWKPQIYQIPKPYFIPIYGAPGKIPIYYPPQPLLVNPRYTGETPFKGYGYLPPKTTLPKVTNRDLFHIDPDSGEDLPVWDVESEESTTRLPSTTTTRRIPTRRTRRPGERRTSPPLFHRPKVEINETAFNTLSTDGNSENDLRPNSFRVEAVAPAAPTRRPVLSSFPRPAPPSFPPRPSPPSPSSRPSPSRCVWAIISCCSANSGDVSYNCFEQLGCTGAFWDNSPCNSDFARAAIDSAMKYYDTQ